MLSTNNLAVLAVAISILRDGEAAVAEEDEVGLTEAADLIEERGEAAETPAGGRDDEAGLIIND